MKRKFTLLIAALALLTMIVQPGRAWGQTRDSYSYTFTSNAWTANGTATLNNVAWTLNMDGGTISNFSNTQGMHFGTNNSTCNSVSISTSGISGTITNVTVEASRGSSLIGVLSISVGGDNFYNGTSTTNALTTSNASYSYTGSASGNINILWTKTSGKGAYYIKSITVTYSTSGGTTPSITAENVDIDYDAIAGSIEYTINNGVEGGVLTASTESEWLTLPTEFASPIQFTCSANEYMAARNATVTLTYNYDAKASVTKNITVTQAGNPDGYGSENNPYTVAQAIANTPSTGNVYIQGIVSAFYNTSIVGDGSNYRYYISDDGTTTTQLLIYKGNGLNNVAFSDINDLLVGDEVVVYGSLVTFQNAPEVAAGNYLYSWNRPTVSVEAPTFDPVAGSYTTAQNVELSCATANTTIFYTIDGTEPTNASTEYSTAISVENTTTIKAIAYAGNESSTVATANYYICSQNNPYTVTEALGFEDYQYPANGIYVHGIVSTAPTAAPNNGQLTYYISVDGEASNQLQVYKGKGLNNTSFTAQTDIQVGDIVTIYGNVKIYNSTKEFDAGNYLVSFYREPVLTTQDVNIACDATEGVITYTVTNPASDGNLTAEITAGNEGNWLTLGTVGANVPFTCTANTGAERTSTVTLTYTYNTTETVTATAVVTQAAYVAPQESIVVEPASISVDAEEHDGTLTITVNNMTIEADDLDIEFYDANEQVITDIPTWILFDDIEASGENFSLYYTIGANNDEARAAYIKVFGFGAADFVYSNLVTINQAAPVTPPTPGTWVLTNLADLTANDIFVIVGTDSDEDTYALPNNGTSAAPTVATITIVNGALSTEPAAELQWNISGNATDGYTFYPNGSTNTWLYCNTTAASGSNNNIRVGTGDRKVFELDSNGYLVTNDDNVDRYLSIYVNSGTAQDWRGYINSNSAPTIAFYKKVNSTDPSITITPAAITEVPCYGGGGLLEVTYANMGDNPNPQIIKCDSDGNPATYDWLTAEFENGTANIRGTISANNSNADRTAYLKVCGTAVNSETVCSNIVSITQLAYPTITTATLPFAFDGDNEELATTAGLAQAGLGSSYGDSPKLKFKETGSFVILHFNEAPNTLTFDIKGDGFDGTFKVQTSADNVTYTDLKEYTSSNLTDNLVSESFNTLNANVRYIKWVYTAATSGKVRLGNIGLTNFSPSITLNTYAISVDANQHDGTLDATYEFIDFTNDPEVVWFESDGVTPAANDPDWVVAIINTDKDFDYTIDENNDAASRTAYFKVYALAETSGNDVYSDLVTVTQEGKVTLYTIMFDTDGGTFVGNDDFNSEIVQKQTGVYSLPSATKDNVTFAGWKLDGTDDIYAAGAQYEVTADASFTAQWSNATTATITFGSAEGSTNITGDNISGNDSDGHTWTITTEGTTSFSPNAGYAQIGSSSKPATSITFTTTLPDDVNITAFSAKFGGFNNTTGDITLKVGETTVGTGALNASTDVIVNSTSIVYGNVLTVTVTNIAKGVKAYYISYSYEMGTDPIIIASSPVDLAYDATSGEIGYSIINPATGVSLDATTTESWISNFVITDDKVTFTTTENTEYISRQGTITLSYQGANNVDVLVNQAAAPMPMDDFALFTGDLVEGDYIIYYNGKAMNTTVTSNRLQYAEVTPANNVIATDNSDIIWHIAPNGEYWTVYNATADAYAASTGTKNQAQMMSDGTDDKALWTVTGTETYEFVNKYNSENSINANLRNNGTYGFACYATGTGGALTLYKRASAIASYKTVIAGYGDNEGGYCLIASPVSADPTNVTNMMTEQAENYDLYWFDQANDEAQWRNYKANSFYLTPGKGYLYARNSDAELTFNGLEYEGNGTINLTYADGATFDGWNLIGNPFGTNTVLDRVYYRMNSAGDGFVAATENTPINKMEGVFVKATEAGQSATFTPSNSKDSKAIAKTNIMVANANGTVVDNVIIRFDGGRTLEKFSFRDGNTKLYIPQDDADYAIVNSNATGEVSLYFKAATTGNYTISMKQSDADLGYLHLIDRLTGADVNMLLDDYTFVGSPRDTENRFIVRFSENSNGMAENNYFAYQNGDQIIVNGNGELQVFDATGRMVMNTNVNGIQTVNVPATGMYIFRMVGESVQTQKIVVR